MTSPNNPHLKEGWADPSPLTAEQVAMLYGVSPRYMHISTPHHSGKSFLDTILKDMKLLDNLTTRPTIRQAERNADGSARTYDVRLENVKPYTETRSIDPSIVTGDELKAGARYTLYRNEQGVPNGEQWIATKITLDTEDKGTTTLVVNLSTGGAFYASREDIFTK